MAPRVSEDYKNRKRLELLRAAKQVFMEKGYTRTTMQDILDEAGVSRGALYAYFDNIEHVYRELLRHEDEKELHFFDPDDTRTAWRQLRNWIQKQQQEIEAIEHSLLLANSEFFLSTHAQPENESRRYLTARYQRITDAIVDFIEKGTARQEFQPRLPAESIALYLVSFIDGLMLDTFHLGMEKTNVHAQIDALLFSLKEMLCPADEAKSL
ncbi:TetR family transcriptional regulator [Brevibacillus borstelensis]|uniref:TetR family transcriptional regulator n=1 Tax=Brevibacillus borstelensis TaxID=45462 RepID=UPI0030C3714A